MRGESDDDFQRRMEAKMARSRRFEQLEQDRAAAEPKRKKDPQARSVPAKKIRVQAQQRREPTPDELKAQADRKLAYLREWRQKRAGRPLGPAPIKTIPDNCLICGRTMRGRGRDDKPDGVTVQHASKGRCNNCLRKINRVKS